jgi:hypothetical protein
MNRRALLAAMAGAFANPWEVAVAQSPLAGSVRPSPSNREESIAALWAEVAKGVTLAQQWLLRRGEMDEAHFKDRNVGAIGVTCFQRANDTMTLAVGALWQRNAEGPERLRDAFSLLYWGAEIQQHWWLRQRLPYTPAEPKVLERFSLHGLAAAGGAPEIANWVAPHQLNVFRATGGTGGVLLSLDPPFGQFFRTLMEAQVRGRWPDRVDRIGMRGYGNVLTKADDRKAFSAALVECCDYRVMQALGYDSMDAPRPRPESRTGSVLDYSGWPKVYPLELFSLRHVYQRTTGRSLSLEAEHPLLKTPLMDVPPLLPLYEDDFIRRARALAQEVFGDAWKPLTPAPLI